MPEDQASSKGLYDKYVSLTETVNALEPSIISMVYKEFKGPNTFYPNIGLFFNEFALVYACSIKSKPETK